MTDTKKPAAPETATAPLGRPYAETVSLEAVWAAAYAAYVVADTWENCRRTGYAGVGTGLADDAAEVANDAVAALLAAHPRGAT